MLRKAFVFLFMVGSLRLYAQDSTAHELKEAVITGFKEEKRNETSVDIISVDGDEMREKGALNISDGLAKMPGISQLTTGTAISKPVIRGLYGNRLLTLISGLRFDNQQWQDEHGLGLGNVGVDRVEVVKGPMSLLYGGDAMGGVLNVIEEARAPLNTTILDIRSNIHSNTLGTTTEIGAKGNNGRSWWRVRAAVESFGDYSQGGKFANADSARVRDSRADGYYGKLTYGWTKKNRVTEFNYHFSWNDFGFMLPDVIGSLPVDSRWSRSLTGPHHTVIFSVLSSQNTISFKSSVLKFNVGIQSNSRREAEGGGRISLNMLLSTGLYSLQWIKPLSKVVELILNNSSSIENNTNYGSRVIIPNAYMVESSTSAFFKFRWQKVIIETGGGINDKWIKTLLTNGVNTPDHSIAPFNKNRFTANVLLGVTYNPFNQFNIKFNAATGSRAPNLAELSSNGLHEGIFHYELGDPNLKTEQNINLDLTLNYTDEWFSIDASVFNNWFFNYIYLQPENMTYFGFPWYNYLQQNAQLYGGEAEVSFTPQGLVKGLQFTGSFSTVQGKTADGNYLPYLPPAKFGGTIRYSHPVKEKVKAVYAWVGTDYVLAQNHLAPLETYTPSYYLLNAGLGARVVFKRTALNISLIGNNLLNARYFDHLSRFKAYGIYNMGRDIILNVDVPITFFNQSKSINSKNKQQ